MSQMADVTSTLRGHPPLLFKAILKGTIMTHSRMAALGVATSVLALIAGQGAAQPVPNPPVASVLTQQPARLESLHASTTDCQSRGIVFAPSGGYQGTADIFDGPTALILRGDRMQDVTSVGIVLANGTRLAPTSMSQCPSGGGLRVVFNLPTVTGPGTRVRLEALAPEPPQLVVRNPPAPQKTCVDRLTGQPTGCPDAPSAPAGARLLKIADVQLLLFQRPHLDSVTPDVISATGSSETCTGRVVFRGTRLGQARLVADAGGVNAGYSHIEVSRTETAITMNTTKRCLRGTIVGTTIFAVAPMRRGPLGRVEEVDHCDSCSDGPVGGARLGGVFLNHRGP
ncbi:MAG: hypothetical protein JWR84_4016 [Caulobacter sp.]|nr:hypothetical protein [Caulobacter sp.]